jgi:DNA repair exonuclease SbcCD nuclease subunit
MPQRPFRFIHAGDLHLECPLTGVAEVPDALRELFLEAPFLAAERVFEHALAEKVDFVVLAGDLLDAALTGPRGPLFLVAQFERLRQRGIVVYWVDGEVDHSAAWPAAIRLPDNVHRFVHDRPEERLHRRGNDALARLVAAGTPQGKPLRLDDFKPERSDLFTIAMSHGSFEQESHSNSVDVPEPSVQYWALGGRHESQTLCEDPHIAHYPGTTQGREPDETGAHGCTLVEVDAIGRAVLITLATDVLRWRHERVAVGRRSTEEDLRRTLAERLQALVAASPGLDQLVTWEIHGEGPLLQYLRQGKMSAEFLAGLRTEFGRSTPSAWSVSLVVSADAVLPADWFGQDNLLGDFLRAAGDALDAPPDDGAVFDVTPLVGRREIWGKALAIEDDTMRRRIVRRAAALGADLLAPPELLP